MIRHIVAPLVALTACGAPSSPERQPLPADTGEATVLVIDTADFLPVDTGSTFPTEDAEPLNTLYIRQSGTWSVSPAGGPFTDIAGTMRVLEYIDELPDPEDPDDEGYACDATYTLTGQAPAQHSCSSCDFVFDIEFFVNAGDPTTCREPDTPMHEAVWRMGYDSTQGKILHDYGGSGIWVPWMDAELLGTDLTFLFEADVAIRVDEDAP